MSTRTEEMSSEVAILFPDAAVTFSLSAGATWAELAGKMEELSSEHEGSVLYLRVACAAPKRDARRRLAA